MGDDAGMFEFVTTVNVAAGFHAGDPGTIRRTVELAAQRGVAVGAHPGLADRVGFGRRALALAPQEAQDDVLYQLGAVAAFCRAAGVPLVHAKMHGALSTHVAERSPRRGRRDRRGGAGVRRRPAAGRAAGLRAGRCRRARRAPDRARGLSGARLRPRRPPARPEPEGRDHPRPRRRRGAGRVDGAPRRVRDPLHPRRQPARGGDRGRAAGGARPRRASASRAF